MEITQDNYATSTNRLRTATLDVIRQWKEKQTTNYIQHKITQSIQDKKRIKIDR